MSRCHHNDSMSVSPVSIAEHKHRKLKNVSKRPDSYAGIADLVCGHNIALDMWIVPATP